MKADDVPERSVMPMSPLAYGKQRSAPRGLTKNEQREHAEAISRHEREYPNGQAVRHKGCE